MGNAAERRRIKTWVPKQLNQLHTKFASSYAVSFFPFSSNIVVMHVRWQSVSKPILEHFIWRRVVIDEGHEVIGDPTLQCMALLCLKFVLKIIFSYALFLQV